MGSSRPSPGAAAAAAAAAGGVPGRLGGSGTRAAAMLGATASSSADCVAALDGREADADFAADLDRRGGGGGYVACLPAAEDARLGVAPLAGRDRRAAFSQTVAEVAPLDLVAPAGVAGADAAAPPVRGVADVELLALGAPVLAGASVVRVVAAEGLPDVAVPGAGASPPARTPAAAGRRSDRTGVPRDAGAARPALEVAISAFGATSVDREDAMAAAA